MEATTFSLRKSVTSHRNIAVPLIGFAALALSLSSVRAQQAPAQIETARQSEATSGVRSFSDLSRGNPREGANLVPTTDNEADVGEQVILIAKDNWEPWRFGIDFGVNHTTNVALLENIEEEDTYIVSGVYGSWTPKIKGNLFGDISIRQHFYRYDKFDDLFNVDIFDADVGLIYVIPKLGDLTLFARYGYLRLSDDFDWGEELFANQSITVGGQKIFRISRGHKAYLGYTSEFSVDATVDVSQRNEHVMYVGYDIKWTEKIETSFLYRGGIYDYAERGRDDINHQIGIGAVYKFTDWARLAANVSFSSNDSDVDGLDYEAWNFGAGLALEIQF